MTRWMISSRGWMMTAAVAVAAVIALGQAPAPGPTEAPGTSPAEAPAEAVAFEFVRRPLAEVAAAISARVGRPIAVRSEALGRQEVTVRLTGADPETLLRRFGEALEPLNIALLREADPARGWYLITFRRAAAAPPGADGEPFVVRVVEGRVRLQGARGAMDLKGGEEGIVTAAGQLLPSRRIDPQTVALWRTGAGPSSSSTPPAGRSVLPLAYRVLGTTDEGQTIVEWESPGSPPQTVILERGTKAFPVPVPLNVGPAGEPEKPR
jgi:hypothetical protein